MTDDSLHKPTPFLDFGMLVVLAIALAKLILHCVFNNRYGFFRDEFDYLACGQHPAWGYVDQPPLVPMIAKVTRFLLGESLRAIRFPAAVASSAIVVIAAMIAREFGGRIFAMVLSAVTVLIAAMYLSDGSLLTTNSFEPILWMGCVYFVILSIRRSDPRYWLWFGVVAGIGLQEKYSIAILGAAIVAGLVLTPHRRVLLNRWLWLGGIAAFLIFLPNLIWNYQHQFPFAQLMHNIKASGRDVELSPLQYFQQQIVLLQPLNAPIWIAGLVALLFAKRFAQFRLLGWCYLFTFAFFALSKGKNYYLAPIYPMLLAAGAVILEAGIERIRQNWLKPVTLTVLLAGGAWLAPIVLPVFPVPQMLAYLNALPFEVPRSEKSHFGAALPQHYADQFGWLDMTAYVARVWQKIPPAERAGCGILARDYGEAGAIDFFGPRYGLPPALSGHQTYFLWGPRGYSGDCLIVLNRRRESLQPLFEKVEYQGTSRNPFELEHHAVFLCRGAKFGTLEQLWPRLKMWD